VDFKNIISKEISKVTQIDNKELESYIEIPKDNGMETIRYRVLNWPKI